jgi:hypothetical protein
MWWHYDGPAWIPAALLLVHTALLVAFLRWLFFTSGRS